MLFDDILISICDKGNMQNDGRNLLLSYLDQSIKCKMNAGCTLNLLFIVNIDEIRGC